MGISFETFRMLGEVRAELVKEIDILKPHLEGLSDSTEVSAKLLANFTEGLIGGLEICLEVIDEKRK
ncbi:hypothetical protein UFOVP536_56 [uncultured Caudovirales phage]|uniref:Uncharacterized protein n=1 Tax=uncultured Caudovirales phage TaxID=2100421 RepID=A0A6J5MTU4_9CAUD|nr:hypothetical protein UFOVP536_56 [uncultured Caudovirales phage]